MADIDEIVKELREAQANATPGPWAWKSCGEKCYSFGLGAKPYYISGPKTKERKTIPDPPISAIGSVDDEFDEKADGFNEVDFTDHIAYSEQQGGQRDFAFCALAFNRMPAILAALEAAHELVSWLDERGRDAPVLAIFNRRVNALRSALGRLAQPHPDPLVAEVERRGKA